MKKQYIVPELEVVKIVSTTTLLAGSDMTLDVTNQEIKDGWVDSREFDFEEED